MNRAIEVLVAITPLALVLSMIYFLSYWKPRHKGSNSARIENLFWATVLAVSVLLLASIALNRHGK